MTALDWLIAAVLALGALLGLTQLPKLWRHKTVLWDGSPPGWWLWGENLYRGWVRSLPIAILTAIALVGGFVVGGLSGKEVSSSGELWDAILLVFASLTVLGFLGMVAIILFNRPKAAVPPHLRNEPGLIEASLHLRTRRKRGPSKS